MNIIEKIVSNKVHEVLERERQRIRADAAQSGFELGQQAQREMYAATETCVSEEATHSLPCPACKKNIHIPCLNYVRSFQKERNEPKED